MISEKKKLKVFLCHANADDKRAIKLYIYLLKHGVQPRRDKDVKPGEVKETAINSMMNESDAILILLSQATTKEEGYMQKQIKYAMEKHKEKSERTIFLIPIKLEECEIPIGDLTKIQSVNWFEKKGPQYLMKALAQRSKQLGCSQISIPNETDPSPDLSKEDNNILESSEDIIMRLTVESDNLREQLKTQSYLYEIKINLLIKENEDLNEIIVDLRIRLKFSEEKTNYLNQQILDYRVEIASLKNKIEVLNEQIFDYKSEIKTLTENNEDLHKQISDYKERIRSHAQKIDELNREILEYKARIKSLTDEKNMLDKEVYNLKAEINQLSITNKDLQEEIDDLRNAKYNGLSFSELRIMVNEKAEIPSDETIEKLKKKYASMKKNGDVSYEAIQHFLSEKKLISFYWVFSRLIDYGISKTDAESIPAIHSNLKRLIDLGLVHREKKESQTVFVHTESGKNFLLRLMATKDPVAKEVHILG